MAQQETMSLTEIFEKFDTEETCRQYLYAQRWPDGFVCPKCGAKSGYVEMDEGFFGSPAKARVSAGEARTKRLSWSTCRWMKKATRSI